MSTPRPPSQTQPSANPSEAASAEGGETAGFTQPPEEAALTRDQFLAPPQAKDEIGRLAHYRVLKQLGAGGMGMVFQAEDTTLERMVALKVMHSSMAANATAKERFIREAKAAAKVKHDHIVSIYTVGEDRGVPFIALEFLQGQPLDVWLKKNPKATVQQGLRIGREMADGLAAAHDRGLIHRDIKPANVWLEAPKGRVKILDFGLARAANDDAQLTREGAVVGTPAYMSPEQARGESLDARTDLFSLGVVLYRMLSGVQPFTGSTTLAVLMSLGVDNPPPVRERNPEVPESLSTLVMRLLSKDRNGRPASAAEVSKELQAIGREAAKGTAKSGPMPVIVPIVAPAPVASPWEDIDASPGSKTIPAAQVEALLPSVTVAPVTQVEDEALPPKSKKKLLIAGGLLGLVAAIVVGVIITITGPDGKETTLDVPPGSKVKVDDKGKVNVTLPKPAVVETPGAAPGREYNLLAHVDTSKDVIAGNWKRAGTELVQTGGESFGVLEFPFRPGAEYDFEVEFTRRGRNKGIVALVLTHEGQMFKWNLGMSSSRAGFDNIDGKVLQAIPGAVRPEYDLTNNRRYVTRVEVRKDRVVGYLADLPPIELKTDFTNLSIVREARLRDPAALGLALWADDVTIHKALVREVDGPGKSTREPPAARYALDFSAETPDNLPHVTLPAMVQPEQPFTVEMIATPRSIGSNPSQRSGGRLFHLGFTFELKQFSDNWDWVASQGKIAPHAIISARQRVVPNRPVHLAAVSTGSESRFFVDGKLVGTKPFTLAPDITQKNLYLGGGPGAGANSGYSAFDGTIEQVRISKGALYDKNYTPPGRFTAEESTQALYLFEVNGGTQLKDSSGKNNHGTIVGATWVKNGEAPATPPPSAFVYLDDLPEVSFRDGLRKVGKHGLDDSLRPFTYRGQQPAHALVTHPKNDLTLKLLYRLDAKYEKFETQVGFIDLAVTVPGKHTFRVVGDGRELWKSPPFSKADDEAACSVSVAGVRELQLEVNCVGKSDGGYAVWLNPRLTAVPTSPAPRLSPAEILTSPDYEWSEPVNLGPNVNGRTKEMHPTVSADGLCLIYSSWRNGGTDLYECRRASVDQPWGPAKAITAVNSGSLDHNCILSADGLVLLFASTRQGMKEQGRSDLFMSKRAARDADWGAPINLGQPINSEAEEKSAALTSDLLTCYFLSDRETPNQRRFLWKTQRKAVDAPWDAPVKLAIPRTVPFEQLQLLADDRTLLHVRGFTNNYAMFIATPRPDGSYEEKSVDPVPDSPPEGFWLMPDGQTMLISTTRQGGHGEGDLWMTRRVPKKKAEGLRWPLAPTKPEDLKYLLDRKGELTLRSAEIGQPPVDRKITDAKDLPAGPATLVGLAFPIAGHELVDADLDVIARMTDLEFLAPGNPNSSSKVNVTKPAIQKLGSLVHLKRLILYGGLRREHFEGIEPLFAAMPELEYLHLPYGMPANWLDSLAKQTQITSLSAYRSDLKEKELEALQALTWLRSLDLRDNQKLPEAAIRRFAAAVPGCRIQWGTSSAMQVIEPTAPQGPKAARPAGDYDAIATGKWVPLLRTEEEFDKVIAAKAFWGEREAQGVLPVYQDGTLKLDGCRFWFPDQTAKNAIIRAKVRKGPGQNLALRLRQTRSEFVAGWYNGNGHFGLGWSRTDYKDLWSATLKDPIPEEFEFALVAVDRKLMLFVDGKKIGEALVPVSGGDPKTASPGMAASRGVGFYRAIEYQSLDVLVPAPPPAKFPFNSDAAKKHQEAWAAHLGVPVEFTNSIGITFRLIPPGGFTMGLTPEQVKEFQKVVLPERDGRPNAFYNDASPGHPVRITKPFYMQVGELTRSQFKTATGRDISQVVNGVDTPGDGLWRNVTWQDGIGFCQKLSEKEKRPAAYAGGEADIRMTGAAGYRLPTEAEWEYACRAGTDTLWFFGNDPDDGQAGMRDRLKSTQTRYRNDEALRNPFGLVDMYGGSSELCWDATNIRKGYSAALLAQRDDPQENFGSSRVRRGGSFFSTGGSDVSHINSFARGSRTQVEQSGYEGFGRVVLPIEVKP